MSKNQHDKLADDDLSAVRITCHVCVCACARCQVVAPSSNTTGWLHPICACRTLSWMCVFHNHHQPTLTVSHLLVGFNAKHTHISTDAAAEHTLPAEPV